MEHISEKFIFPDEELALSAVRAVLPEVGKPHEKRSKVAIKSNKNVVLLEVSADDKHAMLASYHSYKRLLQLCNKLSED